MAERINIAICFDEHMIAPAIVLIHSIYEHARDERPVSVFAINTCVDVDLRGAFADRQCHRFEVTFLTVENPFTFLDGNSYITQGTYLRLMVPQLLSHLEKVIYLDSDIIVNRELSDLYDIDVSDTFCAAARDVCMSIGSKHDHGFALFYDGRRYDFDTYVRNVTGCSSPSSYFNAGVLLLNLKACRSISLAEKVLDFLKERPNLIFLDQDALNRIFEGSHTSLDLRWNTVASAARAPLNKIKRFLFSTDQEWERITSLWYKDPWIIHYAGPSKPWKKMRPKNMDRLWWLYARRAPIERFVNDGFLSKRVKGEVCD